MCTDRILTGKIHPQINLKRLKKIINIDIWLVDTSNQIFTSGSYYSNSIFKKNKADNIKTPIFVKSPFRTPHNVYLKGTVM